MMQQLLSPGVVGAVRTLEEGTVDYIAFSKIAGNSFIGILAAVIGAAATTSSRIPSCLTGWHSSAASAALLS